MNKKMKEKGEKVHFIIKKKEKKLLHHSSNETSFIIKERERETNNIKLELIDTGTYNMMMEKQT